MAISPLSMSVLVARALERGDWRGSAARLLSSAWAPLAARGVVRSLRLPESVRVVTVGGATLGGSGKTPLAIACAEAIAATGAPVAFVGHAYRAAPGRARVVGVHDRMEEVGDEALLAARVLARFGTGVRVVVAPRRSEAVLLASGLARVLVIDGVAQTRPVRASLALLAVDAEEPWGHAASVPPTGDLRAPPAVLLAACDRVVTIGEGQQTDARVVARGAWLGSHLHTWDALVGVRLGLLCALARPERLLRSLARRGLVPVALVRARDHDRFGPRSLAACSRAKVDLWLASPKCALKLKPFAPVPVATLDHGLALSPSLLQRCGGVAPPSVP
jgi:tetraacyldisaccharide 4'-kinase